MLWKINREVTSPSFAFPHTWDIRRNASNAKIYRAQYENTILVNICGAPIWNLLWLPRLLITCTEQTGINISTYPNVLTSKTAQNYEI